MTENATLEARVAAVEKEVADLKERVSHAHSDRPWYEKLIGSMKAFPEFTEVARLGRELRKADAEE